MKIYKETLQGFLQEALSPVYSTITLHTIPGNMTMQQFTVSVACFNRQGRVVELRLQQPAVLYGLAEELQASLERARSDHQFLVKRLESAGFQVLDGDLSETPVAGHIGELPPTGGSITQ